MPPAVSAGATQTLTNATGKRGTVPSEFRCQTKLTLKERTPMNDANASKLTVELQAVGRRITELVTALKQLEQAVAALAEKPPR